MLNPISRQNFADALAENHNLKLEVCHNNVVSTYAIASTYAVASTYTVAITYNVASAYTAAST